ncbi:MAG: hypothetical protein ACRDAI_00410 [Candidatus Rhabdochlamydia sp.]
MQKKYIQVLLSINFCLTAMTAKANLSSNSDIRENIMITNEIEITNDRLEDYLDQFNLILGSLEKINKNDPSILLQNLIAQYKEDIEKLLQYDEGLEEVSIPDLTAQANNLHASLAWIRLKHEIQEPSELHTEITRIANSICEITGYIFSRKTEMTPTDKAFLHHQLGQLQIILQTSVSPLAVALSNQFYHIWLHLNKVNTLHPSELSQTFLEEHKEDMKTPIQFDKLLQNITKEELDNQFNQLNENVTVYFNYLFKEEINEDTKENLEIQFNAIKDCVVKIHEIYENTSSLEENALLKHHLAELQHFLQNLINDKTTDKNHNKHLKTTQALLERCQKEDSEIYKQYEPLINNEEVHSLKFLTDLATEKSFLYFNKSEGFIEIQHKEEGKNPYTTTWKIGKADEHLMKDWKPSEQIIVTETGLFSKYSMSKYLLGESLEYTLNNKGKTYIRANFVCKSTQKNTYTILSIDYHENVVVLKNGPCLFIQGDLNNWHIEDTVVVQKTGAALDLKKSHKLINKTRPSTVSCSLKKKK